MTRRANSRRRFIEICAGAGTIILSAMLVLDGCSKKDNTEAQAEGKTPVDPCEDLTGISENDITVRQKLGYVKESPIPDNQCHNCNLYLPPKEGAKCGGCMLFKGPVYASAYCTYWAPKV
jgi:hypothetical protein